MSDKAKKIIKVVAIVLAAIVSALSALVGMQSCNVTRVITNRSECYQRGDTSVMIQTKTTESYDAKKNGVYPY